MSQFVVDNDGVGASALLTMHVDSNPDWGFTQNDINNNLTACVISGNNEVSMGEDGDELFGKVLAVSQELQPGTTIPAYCTVQARGMARFTYTGTAPRVNQMMEVDGRGRVKRPPTYEHIEIGGHTARRGQVIAVDTINHACDVWLG